MQQAQPCKTTVVTLWSLKVLASLSRLKTWISKEWLALLQPGKSNSKWCPVLMRDSSQSATTISKLTDSCATRSTQISRQAPYNALLSMTLTRTSTKASDLTLSLRVNPFAKQRKSACTPWSLRLAQHRKSFLPSTTQRSPVKLQVSGPVTNTRAQSSLTSRLSPTKPSYRITGTVAVYSGPAKSTAPTEWFDTIY